MYDTQNINTGPLQQYQLSAPTYNAAYIGNPVYSPITNLLYANVASTQGGSIRNPGLIAIQPSGCNQFPILWNTVYGPDSYSFANDIVPRGVPAVTAGGVVFSSSPCAADGNGGCNGSSGTPGAAIWALDASSGQLLNGGKPLLITPGDMRMEPTVDGNWMYVEDNNGDLYALTVDPSVPAIQAVRRRTAVRSMRIPSH
jgi:hypothetical protein